MFRVFDVGRFYITDCICERAAIITAVSNKITTTISKYISCILKSVSSCVLIKRELFTHNR